jgi:hypothetical protein
MLICDLTEINLFLGDSRKCASSSHIRNGVFNDLLFRKTNNIAMETIDSVVGQVSLADRQLAWVQVDFCVLFCFKIYDFLTASVAR